MSAPIVTIYSRNMCHLCEVAHETLVQLQTDYEFTIEKIDIDANPDLQMLYSEQVPVIHINGKPHDFFRVDPERFKAALAEL